MEWDRTKKESGVFVIIILQTDARHRQRTEAILSAIPASIPLSVPVCACLLPPPPSRFITALKRDIIHNHSIFSLLTKMLMEILTAPCRAIPLIQAIVASGLMCMSECLEG